MFKNLKAIFFFSFRFFRVHLNRACFCAFICTMFTACMKDDLDFNRLKNVDWNPNLALPLVNTSMTFMDVLDANPEFQVVVDDNNFCTFIYSDTLYSLVASDIMKIKDQALKYDFSLNSSQISLFANQGNFNWTNEQHISFKANSQAELDSVFFKNGKLNIDVISTFKHDASIRITMPGLVKNGATFSRLVSFKYQDVLPLKTTLFIDLKDYKLDITNSGSAVNDLTVLYKIEIENTGNPVTETDRLAIDGHFENLKFNSVFGYMGQQDFSIPIDTLSFNFFNTHPGIGTFSLADPKLKVTLVNSVGIPVYATIPSFVAFNSTAGSFSVNAGIPNPLPFKCPSVHQIGQSLTGAFELNRNNSNLVSLISHFPEYFTYEVGMKTNPEGKLGQNFITDSSKISLLAEIELPLYGRAKDFIISDTVDFKLEDIGQIESLMLRTSFINGFPIDMVVQVFFTDENYNILDSLIHTDSQLLRSGTVDIFTGKVIAPAEKSTDISFDRAYIQKIVGAKKIITQGRASTADNGNTNVRIYADYELGVRIGALVKTKIFQ